MSIVTSESVKVTQKVLSSKTRTPSNLEKQIIKVEEVLKDKPKTTTNLREMLDSKKFEEMFNSI